jgi:hypothetical protein
MSWEEIIAIVAVLTFVYTIVAGIAGYWISNISKSQEKLASTQDKLAQDMKRIEVMLPSDYVRKIDLDARLDRIENTLGLIFKKLDSKQDKNHA